jgi:hypothetical protein
MPDGRSLSAQGSRGLIRFSLQRIAGVLYVEREEIPRHGLRTVHSVAFPDPGSFKRWFDEDPVRFEHPALHVQLWRDADQLWRIDEQRAPQ